MKKKMIWLIAIVALIFISMAVSAVETEKDGIIKDAAGIISKPFYKLFVGIDNMIDYGFDYFADMKELKEENALLKSKVLLLEKEISLNNEIRWENERLRTLVDLKEKNADFEMTGASVIGIDPSGWHTYFIIDKGLEDGLYKNGVVVDSGGVLGKIEALGTSWARVVTITEPGTACGAQVGRTGDMGIIEGDALLNGICKMTSIPKDANITPGDYIVTSGSGDVYPAGLIIGRVKEIKPEEISLTAIIEPTGNLKNPKEVMVITSDLRLNYEE